MLLGPSGCGKSTLLKMIAGLEDVSDGEIYIDGQLVNYVRPAERNVAMVFQNYALYPHMTVAENIGFPLEDDRRAEAETRQRVPRAAQALGLETATSTAVPSSSPAVSGSGSRLGRAIVREPAVFLMDEPLSNLDAQLRVQTREELLRLHARLQTTTIYVTHDQIEAMTMGHRIVVMRGGVVQQVGPPQDVYDDPANTFVAAFLGSPRINLHAGSIDRSGTEAIFRAEDVAIPLSTRLAQLARLNGAHAETALGIRPEDVRVVLDPSSGVSDQPSLRQQSPSSSRSAPISSSARRPANWPGRPGLPRDCRSFPVSALGSPWICGALTSSARTAAISRSHCRSCAEKGLLGQGWRYGGRDGDRPARPGDCRRHIRRGRGPNVLTSSSSLVA